MIAPYRYILRTATDQTILNPTGVDGLKIRSEKEGENIFHRRKLSGTLRLTDNENSKDFDKVWQIETSAGRCEEIYLDVEKLCSGVYLPEWQGVMGMNDVKWNKSLCQAEFLPRPNDGYRQILENYTKEHNILKLPATDSVSVKLDFEGQFEFLAIEAGTQQDVDDADTWAVFLNIKHWIQGDLFHKGHYEKLDVLFRLITYRDLVAGAAETLDTWTIISQDESSAKYAKVPDLYNFEPYVWASDEDFDKYPELRQIPCNSDYDTVNYIQATDRCLNIRKKITEDRYMNIIWEFGRFNFNRNRKLLNVIHYLVQQTAPDAAPLQPGELSEFFTSEINYVTNEPNKLINLLIAQKSDILSWKSSEAATKGMLSLKDLQEELHSMFDVHWFLNAAGKYQIEHRSYFETLTTVDLTVPKYADYVRGKYAYSYDIDKMPRYQKLTFPTALNEDFEQGIIEYSGACVTYQEGQDTQEKTVSKITTDIEYLVTASGADKNGFVMICQQNNEIAKEAGVITGEILPNAHLAAANLVQAYWTHGRVLFTGLVNGNPKVFRSVEKTKKQVELTIPICCGEEFGAFAEYITELGAAGELVSSDLSLKDQFITLTVAFAAGEPVEGEPVIPKDPRQFDDSFDDSFL